MIKITIEGPQGSGKTTIALDVIAPYYESKGKMVRMYDLVMGHEQIEYRTPYRSGKSDVKIICVQTNEKG